MTHAYETSANAIFFDPAVIQYRDAAEGESFYNYLGFREVDDDEKVQITNAYLADKLIGSIKTDQGQSESGAVFIQHVYVDPAYRGRGVMSELASSALHEAAWNGYTVVAGAFEDAHLQVWFERTMAIMSAHRRMHHNG